MTTDRDKKQAEVVQLYKDKNPSRCTLVLSTGFGKGKVSIDIIKWLKPTDIIILVNADLLRDSTWRAEFIKFGLKTVYDNRVTMVNYQTAYKWNRKDFGDLSNTLVIADEVDFAAGTKQFGKFFEEFKDVRTIGLTGFITESKRSWFTTILPILIEYDAIAAQDEGVLNKIQYIFIKYDLSRNPKDLKVTYKQNGVEKSFTQSQNNAYSYNEAKHQKIISDRRTVNKSYMMNQLNRGDYNKEIKNLKYLEDMIVKTRSEILLNNIGGAIIAKNLLNFLLKENENNKIIVFSKRTKQSLEICGEDYAYHGGVNKAKAAQNYHYFEVGAKRLMGVCDKVNRGANIDKLNVAIFESFDGSDTKATQRFGRMMRLLPDEIAKVYILLPYYMREEPDKTTFTLQETRQVEWARSMVRSSGATKENSVVWDYKTVKDEHLKV